MLPESLVYILGLLTVSCVRDDSLCLDGYWKYTVLSDFKNRIWKLRIWDRQLRQNNIKIIHIVFSAGPDETLFCDSFCLWVSSFPILILVSRIGFRLFCNCCWVFWKRFQGSKIVINPISLSLSTFIMPVNKFSLGDS